MTAAFALAAMSVASPAPITVGDGFLMPTQYRTIARYQLSLDPETEYQKLLRTARDNSLRRPPRTLRVLQIIVPEIDAQIEDKDGNKVQAKSLMTSAEINRCREWFDNYTNLVHVYTAGALRVEQSELILDRKVSDKRTFPAIDISRSGTRKEELITDPQLLKKMYVLRRILNPMGTMDAIDFLLDKLRNTKNNSEFFESMNT